MVHDDTRPLFPAYIMQRTCLLKIDVWFSIVFMVVVVGGRRLGYTLRGWEEWASVTPEQRRLLSRLLLCSTNNSSDHVP